jgi:hypothetical protein
MSRVAEPDRVLLTLSLTDIIGTPERAAGAYWLQNEPDPPEASACSRETAITKRISEDYLSD